MKYHKLVENAAKPNGFWGKVMIKSMNKNHSALTDWGLEHIQITMGSKVLDVGCGGGQTVSKLCNKVGNGKVCGIDYSELCVKKSRKLNSKNILCEKAIIKQAPVSALPFEDNCFDVVTAVETFYFWPDKQNDLKEVLRVLKTGGKLLMIFEMLKSDADPFKWERVEEMLGIKAVTENEIAQLLTNCGYVNVKTYTQNGTSWLCAVAEKPKEQI